MLDDTKPDFVWAFVENNRHLEIVKACAGRKIFCHFREAAEADREGRGGDSRHCDEELHLRDDQLSDGVVGVQLHGEEGWRIPNCAGQSIPSARRGGTRRAGVRRGRAIRSSSNG